MSSKKRSHVMFDLILLEVLTVVFVSYCFPGVTSACDGFMHLSKVKILMDNLRAHGYFPRWNPYWYFGVPMWRIYSPLSYYIVALLGWILNLSLLDIVTTWTYLAFSAASISTYLLAMELGLNRSGCLAGGILFLTSGNLLLYWGSGSYPNVTGVALSPLVLLSFLRAVKNRSFANILAAGLSLSAVVLTYAMNAAILFFFILILSILLVTADRSLLFVSRGLKKPPKYTFTLPKILISTLLIAAGLSMWWALPFLMTYAGAPAIPEATSGISETEDVLLEQIFRILGVRLSRSELPFSPGIGHTTLALVGCGFAVPKRKVESAIAPICLASAFIFSLAPWLSISMEPLFWWRSSLYFSLFAALCGGVAIDSLKSLHGRFMNADLLAGFSEESAKIYSLSVIMLVLLVSVYPVVGSNEFVFSSYDLSVPSDMRLLESCMELGERIGVEGSISYGLNMFTNVSQSGGGNIHYVYMVNEFAYVFWRYMFSEREDRYLRYFARCYNVRWFMDFEMVGLARANSDLRHEVVGFNSSLAEVIGRDGELVLFVGDKREYSRFFLSIALSDPEDIIPVYGGNTLDEYDVAALRNFDAVYLSTLKSKDLSSLSQILSGYVEGGGCLILDTGNVELEAEMNDLPSPSPVEKIVYEESHLVLSPIISHYVTEDLDFEKFGAGESYTISRAESLRNGASVLICDEGKPVLVHWERGLGKTFWTGLRLPHLIMLHKGRETEREEVKLFINLLRQATSGETESSRGLVHFRQTCPEEIKVHVKDGSSEDALWLKMSYYPGWTAQIEDEAQTGLRIFRAGPNMMLVFPDRRGDYAVRFYFDKTFDVKVGEYISLVSIIVLLVAAFYKAFSHKKKSEKH